MDIAGPDATSRLPPTARTALIVAAAAGVLHGLFSLYWAFGGDWLVNTLGRQLTETFADLRWLLIPVAAVKIGFALLPLLLARTGRFGQRWWRLLCWTGAVVLVGWGGLNTVTSNLVLSGVLRPGRGYDRDGMIGHAWLWDPLFLVWGLALTVALLRTRRGRAKPATG